MIGTQFNPKVSIVIPVYNGANYMREAIDSALDQTYQNIEVLVINDGSNDGGETEKISLSYGNSIRYFKKENGGVSSAFNLGIQNMKGEYFSWLSHDDVYYPDKIATQINYLNTLSNKSVALYSDYEYINLESNFVSLKVNGHIEPSRLQYEIIRSCPIHGSTVLISKEIFSKIGFFNEDLSVIQDFEMWYRISEYFDFIHQKEVLSKVRLHSEQGIANFNLQEIKEVNNFFFNYLKKTTDEELKVASGEKSIATTYAKLAIKHKRRRVSDVSIYASRQAKKHLFNDNGVTIICNLCYILWCDTCNLSFKILNSIKKKPSGPTINYLLNGWLQRLKNILK